MRTDLRDRTVSLLSVLWIALAASSVAQQKVCPISEDRMAKADAEFARIAAVFRQPRCINCHGGVNPFTPNTQHAGGSYDVARDGDGDILTGKTFDPCQSCHGDFRDWRTAPEDMSFTGKDDAALCKQVKRNFISGQDFIEHLLFDRGNPPFIEVGFKGTRGLNQTGRDLVEHYRPEPIQGVTQPQLVAMGRDWLHYLGSTIGPIASQTGDCGCVQHHYGLEVHTHAAIQTQDIHWDAGFGSDPVIRLVFDDDGTFHSQGTTTAEAGAGSGGPCTMAGGGTVTLSAKGKLVDGTKLNSFDQQELIPDERMKVKVTGSTTGGSGRADCPGGHYSVGGLAGSGSLDFELDAVVGAKSQEIPALPGVPGAGGTSWVKIVQID